MIAGLIGAQHGYYEVLARDRALNGVLLDAVSGRSLSTEPTSQWTQITRTDTDFETFEPDVLLEDEQDLSAYGLDARVVHLPGHSSGSIGILADGGDLFCGDLLVNVTRPSLHYYIDDLAQARESIGKLSGLGVTTVYPGHGRPFPLGELSIPDRSRGSVPR